MSKEQEPEQLASISISQDEVESRTRPKAKPRAHGSSGGSSKIVWAILLFTLALSIGLLVQFYKLQGQSDKQLQAIAALQKRLVSTDEQANLSVDALKVIIKEQDHEIRKLWDVSNKRNKRNINKNADRLDAQNKQITQHDKRIGRVAAEVEKAEKSLAGDIAQLKKDMNTQMSQLKEQNKLLQQDVDNAINALPSDLAATLERHEKGIKAMDATRLRLLKRINVLESELKTLAAAQKASPAPQSTP